VNLGNIEPLNTATATWNMVSSLQGKFIEYSASFRHVDDLGNPRTSLIDSVDIHELEHIVRVVDPADDSKPDFLANDIPDPDNLPDRLWLSNGITAPVTAITSVTIDGPAAYNHLKVHLTISGPPSGFVYVRADDPGQADFVLVRVVRSDGREIRMDDNAWTTKRTIRLQGQAPYRQYRAYIFDSNTTGSYTLYYQPVGPAPLPIISGLSPNWTRAGSPDFNLTVSGSNFIDGATVYWDIAPLSTTYLSPTALRASVPGLQLSKVGTIPVRVVNPAVVGGGASNTFPFTIAPSRNYGDVNGDGVITVEDALIVLRVAGGLATLPDITTADLAPYPSTAPRGYGDGIVNMRDAVSVLQALLAGSTGG